MTGEELLVKVDELMDDNFKVLEEKNEKYGNSFTDSIERYGDVAALTRLFDKFNRMENMILDSDTGYSTDESLYDTCLDMANYLYMFVATSLILRDERVLQEEDTMEIKLNEEEIKNVTAKPKVNKKKDQTFNPTKKYYWCKDESGDRLYVSHSIIKFDDTQFSDEPNYETYRKSEFNVVEIRGSMFFTSASSDLYLLYPVDIETLEKVEFSWGDYEDGLYNKE